MIEIIIITITIINNNSIIQKSLAPIFMFSKFLDDQKRWSINFHLFEIFLFLLKSFSLIVSSIYFIREIIDFRLWKLRVFTILQERLRDNARDKYRNLSEKKKTNKVGENMEEIDTIMCLKRRSKNSKKLKEIIVKPAKVKRLHFLWI